MKRLLSSLATVIIIGCSTFSQENIHSALKDTINLDEVVVTGTTVKVNKCNVPMAVSVVNNLQISESNETALLPILNGRVPGLVVTERGVMGFGVPTNASGDNCFRRIETQNITKNRKYLRC